MEKFDPSDPKYKKVEDLPKEEQGDFVDVNDGFVGKEAALFQKNMQDVERVSRFSGYKPSVLESERVMELQAREEDAQRDWDALSGEEKLSMLEGEGSLRLPESIRTLQGYLANMIAAERQDSFGTKISVSEYLRPDQIKFTQLVARIDSGVRWYGIGQTQEDQRLAMINSNRDIISEVINEHPEVKEKAEQMLAELNGKNYFSVMQEIEDRRQARIKKTLG